MNYEIISEETLIQANKMMQDIGDTENNFRKLLEVGKMMKDEGLTPVYLYDEQDTIRVVVKETMQKEKLN